MQGDAVAAQAGLDPGEHLERLRVDDEDLVRVLGRDVGALAVGREDDAARPRPDRHLGDLRPLGDVDDVDRLAVLGADEHVAAVGREDRVLGVLSPHLDHERLRVRPRIDEDDLVRLLDRGGDPAPVGRDADAFGRRADRDRPRALARRQVDDHQRTVRLVADVGGAAIGRDHGSARLLADVDLGDDLVDRGVDDAERARAFIGNEGERCRGDGEWRGERGGEDKPG
jgi:hypothetical protein